MQATARGQVTDLDRNNWDFDGRQGVAYGAFVSGSPREAPQRIRMTEEQYATCAVGSTVEWPVDIEARTNAYGTPKLRVTLDPEYVVRVAVDAEAAASLASYSPDPAF